MLKKKTWIPLAVILILATLFLTFRIEALVIEKKPNENVSPRADLIYIDSMKTFGKLERPKVLFVHDLHTEALKKENKDCTTCHLFEKNRLSPKFKRIKDTSRQEVMDIYHLNCIECHTERIKSKKKTGPVVCGECHNEKTEFTSSRVPMGFDKSLHSKHAEINENKCELCHHEYDKKIKKLFYAKGKEGTCRYCHKKETEENRIAMQQASHLACIKCHREKEAEKKPAGPIQCSNCHNPDVLKDIKKVEPPRMKRQQPDIVMVLRSTAEGKDVETERGMNPVPFNHKAHETYNDTCRVCHHADLKSCAECHTMTGTKKGKNINLLQSMHQNNTKQSCIGCHEMNQQKKECAGCHSGMAMNREQDNASCKSCHIKPLNKNTGITLSASEKNRQATEIIESREIKTRIYSDKDIPENVLIKGLSDKYEPVEFPHRKIVKKLADNIKDNKLANYFHRENATLCQGCHHNSPPDKAPPSCISCHGKPFNEKNIFMPGITGAYHIQCMRCHNEMGLEKPSAGCTDCHKERK